MNVAVIPEMKVKMPKPTGDTVTGKPMTNSAVVALDTRISLAHRRRTAEIPYLTEERRLKCHYFFLVAVEMKKHGAHSYSKI
jgi:hypothetical protein